MVRTSKNEDLIKEIDGGIKKEVSVGCAVSEHICSVCGKPAGKGGCNHLRGKVYNGKTCYHILSGVTDAYEWSFVAVPAQPAAGVQPASKVQTVNCLIPAICTVKVKDGSELLIQSRVPVYQLGVLTTMPVNATLQ